MDKQREQGEHCLPSCASVHGDEEAMDHRRVERLATLQLHEALSGGADILYNVSGMFDTPVLSF